MTTTPINSGLATMATAPLTGSSAGQMRKNGGAGTWFEALSQAWGETLDKQANRIEVMSDSISDGGDNPSQLTKLTTESLRMSFMSNSSSSSIDSVGKALETMARKQ